MSIFDDIFQDSVRPALQELNARTIQVVQDDGTSTVDITAIVGAITSTERDLSVTGAGRLVEFTREVLIPKDAELGDVSLTVKRFLEIDGSRWRIVSDAAETGSYWRVEVRQSDVIERAKPNINARR